VRKITAERGSCPTDINKRILGPHTSFSSHCAAFLRCANEVLQQGYAWTQVLPGICRLVLDAVGMFRLTFGERAVMRQEEQLQVLDDPGCIEPMVSEGQRLGVEVSEL
jgi:hypothetical protein